VITEVELTGARQAICALWMVKDARALAS